MAAGRSALAFVGALLVSVPATAQNVTVQQPAFRVFSATTTVSVADRGAAFLGGASSAADSRRSFGPFRSGTSTGVERSHAGISVGVWIHDFSELDRQALGTAARRDRDEARPVLTGYAAHSFEQLQQRRTGTIARAGSGSQSGLRTTAPRDSDRRLRGRQSLTALQFSRRTTGW